MILLILFQVDRAPEEILYSHNHETFNDAGIFGNSYLKREMCILYFFRFVWWVVVPCHVGLQLYGFSFALQELIYFQVTLLLLMVITFVAVNYLMRKYHHFEF